MKLIRKALTERGITFHEMADIRPFLTIKVGSPVRLIAEINNPIDLEELARLLIQHNHPMVVIGGGSNVVFAENNSQLTVLVNRSSRINRVSSNLIEMDSGVSNHRLLKYCHSEGLGDLEFLSGIPGTVGGAAAVNAGAYGQAIADVLHSADILDDCGNRLKVDPGYFNFSYRESCFKFGQGIILRLALKINPGQKEIIGQRIDKILKSRKRSHPSGRQLTAGCFFKNPDVEGKKVSAGKLIESCQIKNTRFGDVYISDKHHNFLMNRGGASFRDVAAAEVNIRRAVFEKKEISLEREVIYIRENGRKE